MKFRDYVVKKVIVLKSTTPTELEIALEKLMKRYEVIDVQFGVGVNNFYALVLRGNPTGIELCEKCEGEVEGNVTKCFHCGTELPCRCTEPTSHSTDGICDRCHRKKLIKAEDKRTEESPEIGNA